MLCHRLGTVNDCHWEFKPVLSYSKHHTFSTFFWRRKRKKICIYSLQPGHLEAEQNDKKVKRSNIKTKGVKTREVLVQASSACENHRFVVAKWPRLEKKLNNVYIQKI